MSHAHAARCEVRVPLSLTDLINIQFALERQIDKELAPKFNKVWQDTLDKITIAREHYEASIQKDIKKYGPKDL